MPAPVSKTVSDAKRRLQITIGWGRKFKIALALLLLVVGIALIMSGTQCDFSVADLASWVTWKSRVLNCVRALSWDQQQRALLWLAGTLSGILLLIVTGYLFYRLIATLNYTRWIQTRIGVLRPFAGPKSLDDRAPVPRIEYERHTRDDYFTFIIQQLGGTDQFTEDRSSPFLYILDSSGYDTFVSKFSPLHQALTNFKGEMRILLSDPNSPGARGRAGKLGRSEGQHANTIRASIDFVNDLSRRSGRVSLRVYGHYPGWRLIITSTSCGVQWFSDSDVDWSDSILVENAKSTVALYDGFIKEFLRVWEGSSYPHTDATRSRD